MAFSTLFFLFVFLPLSLVLYYIVPKRFRAIPLALASLVFFAWDEPRYLLLLAASLVFNYVTGLELALLKREERPTAAKVAMILAVIVNLLLLGFFKYYGFLIANLNGLLNLRLAAPRLAAPLGLSFYTFTVLSYVLDVYLERAEAQRNFLSFLVYASFFPKLSSGPIVQYKDMESQLTERKTAPAKLGAGLNLFLVGLFKKVLLADHMSAVFASIDRLSAMSAGTAWLGMILYSLQLYFDFSGYSDMAIGLAKMFGFDFAKNFDYPYLSDGISEFWRRWHISLGAWFRDYVYIPLGGSRGTTRQTVRNLLVVWLLTGLWHGASWSFLAWGLYHGALVLLEKFVLKERWEKLPRPLRIGLNTLLVFFGWVLFFSPGLGSALRYYGQMFGLGHMGVFDGTFRYYLSGSAILLILGFLGCGPLARRAHQLLAYRRGGALTYLSAAAYLLLLVLSVACMVGATYSSFLYFQF